MTDEAVARRVPWATIIGWVALLLAVVGAVGVALAGVYAVDGARNPQSFGTLGAVVVLMYSLIPSLHSMNRSPSASGTTNVVTLHSCPIPSALVSMLRNRAPSPASASSNPSARAAWARSTSPTRSRSGARSRSS